MAQPRELATFQSLRWNFLYTQAPISSGGGIFPARRPYSTNRAYPELRLVVSKNPAVMSSFFRSTRPLFRRRPVTTEELSRRFSFASAIRSEAPASIPCMASSTISRSHLARAFSSSSTPSSSIAPPWVIASAGYPPGTSRSPSRSGPGCQGLPGLESGWSGRAR